MNRHYLRAIPREWRTVSRAFTALGDEHRQRILLTFEKGERLNVGQIAEVSTLSRSAVSHHLKLLREAGVLAIRRRSARRSSTGSTRPFLEESLGAVLDFIKEQGLMSRRRASSRCSASAVSRRSSGRSSWARRTTTSSSSPSRCSRPTTRREWGGGGRRRRAGFVIGAIFIAPFLLFSATVGPARRQDRQAGA